MLRQNKIIATAIILLTSCAPKPHLEQFKECKIGIEDDQYTKIYSDHISFVSGNWFFWAPWMNQQVETITDLKSRYDLSLKRENKEIENSGYFIEADALFNDKCLFYVFDKSYPIDNSVLISLGYIRDPHIILDYGVHVGMTKKELAYVFGLPQKYEGAFNRASYISVDSILDGQHWEFHFRNNKLYEIRIKS